jgi:hypothetical protein
MEGERTAKLHEKELRGTAQLKDLRVKVGEWNNGKDNSSYPHEWSVWYRKHCCEMLERIGERNDHPDEI